MFRLSGHAGVLLAACLVATPLLARQSDLSAELERVNQIIRQGRLAEARGLALGLVAKTERSGDRRSLVRALNLVADVFYYEGRRDDMLRFYERALGVNRELGDAAGTGRSLYNIGYYYERTDPARMLQLLDEARGWADKAGDRALQMNIYNARGTAGWNLGRYKAASEDFAASARLGEEQKNLYAAAVAYQNVGLSHYHRSDYRHAREWLERAQSVFEAQGLKPGLAIVLGNLGNLAREMGDLDRAAAFYERSLALHRETQSPRGEAAQLNNIGDLYAYGGHTSRSRDYHRQALEAFRKIGDNRGAVQQLISLAAHAIALEARADARALLSEAQDIATRLGDPFLLGRVGMTEARLARAEGRTADAAARLNQAVERSRGLDDPFGLGLALAARADLRAEMSEPARALEDYDAAIRLHERSGSRIGLHVWHANAARMLAAIGRPTDAVARFDRARAELDDLSRLVSAEPFRLGLFRELSEVHNAYARFLIDQGRVADAWRMVEEGRARDLQLRLVLAGRAVAGTDAQLDALGRINALQRTLREGTTPPPERAIVMRQIADAELAYDTARSGRRGDTAPATASTPAPASAAMPGDAVVITYAVAGDELLVFRHVGGEHTARRVTGVSALAEKVLFYARRVATPEAAFADASVGRGLYDTLIGPELKDTNALRILILPDGPLLQLPFAALVEPDGAFLIERRSVLTSPSLAVFSSSGATAVAPRPLLAVASSRFTGTTLTGVELPDLPAAEHEARRVAASARGSTAMTGVSERAFKIVDLNQYQVVHLATHIVADTARPDRSAIVLGSSEGEDDGFLQAREIYDLSLPVALAVVSGCSSGRGQVVAGEGVLGLSHALFSAGARALVLSLWDVSDRATARFMEDFYRQLGSAPIDEALARAQRIAIADPARRHPAYWAAFFVSGNGAGTIALPRPVPWAWISVIAASVFLVWLLVVLRRLVAL